eukprot:TRINITY_DN835_c0_g1_i2.p1 TRINITY_DN835_c0_g1~~TRINITY_DN835_c0_g1_i2.p1  ORF type:complete len:529 (-),score=58.31 TRINITY_DN835_c0_g1_i2:336-1841(-)
MNDSTQTLEFPLHFPQLNSTVFSTDNFNEVKFHEVLKNIVIKVLPKEAKLDDEVVRLKRRGNKVDVVVRMAKGTMSTSMFQRAYSNLQLGALRSVFVNSEEMQELVRNVSAQILDLEEADPQITQKMMHITQGISDANQVFMSSANELMSEVGNALQKTQVELSKDLILHRGLEKDAEHYRAQLIILQQKLHETEKQLSATERKLNESVFEYDAQMNLLQNENQHLKQREQELLVEIEVLQSEVSVLKNETEVLQTVVENRQQKVEELEGQLKTAFSQMEEEAVWLADKQKEIEALKMTKQVMENNLEQISKASANVLGMAGLVVDQLDVQSLEQVHTTMVDLQSQIQGLKNELNTSNEKILSKETELKNLREQLKVSGINVEQRQLELQNVQKELKGSKEAFGTVERNINDKVKQIAGLENEKINLQSELEKQKLDTLRLGKELEDYKKLCEKYRAFIEVATGVHTLSNFILGNDQNSTNVMGILGVLSDVMKEKMKFGL